MAYAKKDLDRKVTEADKELLAKLEEKIDAELQASYVPGGSVSVPVKDSEYNERVLRMLKAVYQDDEHGWAVELASDQKESQDYLVFR